MIGDKRNPVALVLPPQTRYSIPQRRGEACLNGVEVITATDKTYAAGNPGMGFNYGVGKTNADFGFSSYEVDSYND